LAPEAERVSS